MMIQKIYSAPSFGKKLVGEFKVHKKELFGTDRKVPVQIWRLENDEDFEEYLADESIKYINMKEFFYHKRYDGPWTYDYVITPKDSHKVLGAADCIKYDDCMEIETIGTSTNKNYSGIGRALIAGIVKDIKENIKGKIKELNVPYPAETAKGFYDKCHFTYCGCVSGFCMPEQDYDKVIKDAKKQ